MASITQNNTYTPKTGVRALHGLDLLFALKPNCFPPGSYREKVFSLSTAGYPGCKQNESPWSLWFILHAQG